MTVFELSKIELENLNYPIRKTRKYTLGIYSSLDKTYEALQEFVAEEEPYMKYIMGYIVEERVFDASYWDNVIISTYTYTNGILNDGCVWTNENDPGGLNPFYGRPKEKIRFKLGDIVEVCQGGESELHIIHHTPTSTEEFEKRCKARWEKEGDSPENGTWLDSTDDCYMAYSIGIGDTHGHPEAPYVFAPTKKVPSKIKRKLQGKLLEQIITSGHHVQISELPFAKDSKVLDEVLSNWEKLVKPKIYKEKKWVYDEIRCLVVYNDADTIKSQLDFSEKQTKRFDCFYEKCKRLVEERQKEVQT